MAKNKEKIRYPPHKYGHFKMLPFNFPKETLLPETFFKNEKEFEAFIWNNEWFQRSLGITNLKGNGNFPDVRADILFYEGEKIRIELEHIAENFILHKHNGFGCDLIVSFLRKKRTPTIRGLPVWSVYRWDKEKQIWIFSLWDDIHYVEDPEDDDEGESG